MNEKAKPIPGGGYPANPGNPRPAKQAPVYITGLHLHYYVPYYVPDNLWNND